MCLPVLYKADEESGWHEGVTVNLSAEGALIDGDMPAAETVVVVIPLLSADGCLTGRGRVVRTPSAESEHGRFAIVVPHYRLQAQAAALRESRHAAPGVLAPLVTSG